jgi:hypothetical protein
VPRAAATFAELDHGQAHELVVRGLGLHSLEQLARAALGLVALAPQSLRFAHARGERVAQALELGERQQMRAARVLAASLAALPAHTGARRRGDVGEARGDDHGELVLELGDLRLERRARGAFGRGAGRGPRIAGDLIVATTGGELLGGDHQRIYSHSPSSCAFARQRGRGATDSRDSTVPAKPLPEVLHRGVTRAPSASSRTSRAPPRRAATARREPAARTGSPPP